MTYLHGADFEVRFEYKDDKGRDQTIEYHVMRARVCLTCGSVIPMLGAKNLARLQQSIAKLSPIETNER